MAEKKTKEKKDKGNIKLKVLESEGNFLRFEMRGIDETIANAIRRASRTKCNVLAIDYVDIIKNSSALYNEMLAHRIGLIPLKFDKDAYIKKELCTCKGKGCAKCEVKLVLKKKGPCVVYAKDLKSTKDDVYPANGNEIIVILKGGQEIELEATATMNNGSRHARWQSCIIGYQYFPKLKIINKGMSMDEAKKIVECCPKKALILSGKEIRLENPYLCDICGLCEEESNGNVKMMGDSTHIIFNVESVSGLAPADIIKCAIKEIISDINEFEELVDKEL